jgi:hypothetical protein
MADNERKICRIKKYGRTLQPRLREKNKGRRKNYYEEDDVQGCG